MKKEKNHKFNKGDKFVIEIAEAHTHWSDNDYPISLYRIKGFATLVFDDKGLTRLVEQMKEGAE